MLNLYLLIGPSGSGKSFLAKELAQSNNAIICSADHYFYDSLGNYNFDIKKLGHAHKMCYDKAKRYLSDGKDVIIDNTNLIAKDRNKYKDLALEFGAKVTILTSRVNWSTDVEVLMKKNTKGTPKDVLERHVEQFKRILENIDSL